MSKTPAAFPDVPIIDPSFGSFFLLAEKLTPAMAFAVTFLLLVFVSVHAGILSRAPERISSTSNHYTHTVNSSQHHMTFGFAVQHLDLLPDRIVLRSRFLNPLLSLKHLSFNRTAKFLKNSSIVLVEKRQFLQIRKSDLIDLINEKSRPDYDAVSFIFEFEEYSDQTSDVELIWLYSNVDSTIFLAKMNRIFANLTIYCFVCFLVAVSSGVRFETHLTIAFWFLLLILGFGGSHSRAKCLAGSVFVLKVILCSLIRHSDRILNFAIIAFVHEFLEFSPLRDFAGWGHFLYSIVFLWIAWPEARCISGRDLLPRLLGGLSCCVGLTVYCLLPALHLLENSVVPEATYRVAHWAIGLVVAFGEVPVLAKGSRAFHCLGAV
jgi:hypothetical protein